MLGDHGLTGLAVLAVLGHLGVEALAPAHGAAHLVQLERAQQVLEQARRDLLAKVALHDVLAGKLLGVAAEQDVRTTTGHVGGDGHGAGMAGLRHHVGLAFVELGVQDLVLDAALIKQAREALGALDGDGAHQHGLTLGMAFLDVVGHGVELGGDGAVHQVLAVLADDGLVGWDHLHGQLVDLAELGVLGKRGTGHAGELVVETEIVLQRDGGERLVLLAHVHVLLGLHGLVQALGPATALHDAAGELVDDLHLAVHDHVVLVAVEHVLGLERLLQVVHELAGEVGIDVVDAERALDLAEALLGGGEPRP